MLVADSHPLVRAGLRATLDDSHDLSLVGEATSGHEAWQLCEELRPDILLLDIRLPDMDACEVAGALRDHCPEVRLLILAFTVDVASLYELVGRGVAGYVLHSETTEAVIYAIRTVMHGGTWFSRPVMEKLVCREQVQAAEPLLSKSKQQLLEMIARGWENARIAAELNLAEQTVRNYVSSLYLELDVHSRAEAIVWAREHNIGGRWYPVAEPPEQSVSSVK